MRAKRYSAVAGSALPLLKKPLRIIFPAESWGLWSALTSLYLLLVGYLSEEGLAGLNWLNVGERREMYLGRETEKRREKHKIIIPSPFQMPQRELRTREETELWKKKKKKNRKREWGRDNMRDGKRIRGTEKVREKSLCMRIAYETNIRYLWKRSQYETEWRWGRVCVWGRGMCVCVYRHMCPCTGK